MDGWDAGEQGAASRLMGVAPGEEGLALFQRALERRDPAAWEAIVGRYRGLVLDWVRRAARAPIPREHEDDWVTRAFERFWLAVGPGDSRFRDLPAALQYLKLCVRSVVLDDVRARLGAPAEPLDGLPEHHFLGLAGGSAGSRDVESTVLDRCAAGDLWQIVLRELAAPAEQLVAYRAFVQGMKPGEIADRHPEHFRSVTDVYRTKRNALDRLRRSPRLLAHLEALGQRPTASTLARLGAVPGRSPVRVERAPGPSLGAARLARVGPPPQSREHCARLGTGCQGEPGGVADQRATGEGVADYAPAATGSGSTV